MRNPHALSRSLMLALSMGILVGCPGVGIPKPSGDSSPSPAGNVTPSQAPGEKKSLAVDLLDGAAGVEPQTVEVNQELELLLNFDPGKFQNLALGKEGKVKIKVSWGDGEKADERELSAEDLEWRPKHRYTKPGKKSIRILFLTQLSGEEKWTPSSEKPKVVEVTVNPPATPAPTATPSAAVTTAPTQAPTAAPTASPTTQAPSPTPTPAPTPTPTPNPTPLTTLVFSSVATGDFQVDRVLATTFYRFASKSATESYTGAEVLKCLGDGTCGTAVIGPFTDDAVPPISDQGTYSATTSKIEARYPVQISGRGYIAVFKKSDQLVLGRINAVRVIDGTKYLDPDGYLEWEAGKLPKTRNP